MNNQQQPFILPNFQNNNNNMIKSKSLNKQRSLKQNRQRKNSNDFIQKNIKNVNNLENKKQKNNDVKNKDNKKQSLKENKKKEINKKEEEKKTEIKKEEIVEDRLEGLKFKEREILTAYYVEGMTAEDIGNRLYFQLFSQTRSGRHIQRIIEKATEKMVKL